MMVALCSPYRDRDLKHEFFFSVLDLVTYTAERKRHKLNLGFLQGTIIHELRNRLFYQAKEEGADYIFFVDSDMVFPQDALEQLLDNNRGRDVVTGVYYQRYAPYLPVVFQSRENAYEDMYEIPDKSFRVSACGAGFLLISKKVMNLFDMNDAKRTGGHPFTPIINKDWEAHGEDISFCIRMERMGIEIWADPTIKVGHVARSMVVYPEDYLENRKHTQEETSD
jgi:GT2 family glycosyltransferase